MAGEGRETILFLDRNRIFVYDGNATAKLEIPATIIRDLDIIDKVSFDGLVNDFIRVHKIEPAKIWLVLADSICFSRDFNEPDPVKFEDKVKDFLEAVPFDQLISRKYKSAMGVRMITTNLELIEAITEIFERNNFYIEGIVPQAIFQGFTVKKILDPDFAKFIISNKKLMVQSNMLTKREVPVSVPAEATGPSKKPSKFFPYMLIGFGVLALVLLVLVYFRFLRH